MTNPVTNPAAANWTHSYPYEPGETGDGAYIRFDLPGYSWTATVTSVDSLASWIAGEAKIYSYTIVRPGDLSSDALAFIMGTLLAGVYHRDESANGWDDTLAGIREWELTTDLHELANDELDALVQKAIDAGQGDALRCRNLWDERAARIENALLAAQVEVGDELTVHVNQGERRAVVVAVQEGGDHCIVEYVMPNRRTYPGVAHKSNTARAINGTGRGGNGPFGSRPPKWAVEQLASQERAELVEELIESIEYDHPLTRQQQRNVWQAMAKGFTYMDLAKGGVDAARLHLRRLAFEARRNS